MFKSTPRQSALGTGSRWVLCLSCLHEFVWVEIWKKEMAQSMVRGGMAGGLVAGLLYYNR